MKNVNEMSVDECCHELERHKGWNIDNPDADERMPRTLDAAASAMPVGRHIQIVITTLDNGDPFVSCVSWRNTDARPGMHVRAHADTELLARMRLAVACHRANKESTNAQ